MTLSLAYFRCTLRSAGDGADPDRHRQTDRHTYRQTETGGEETRRETKHDDAIFAYRYVCRVGLWQIQNSVQVVGLVMSRTKKKKMESRRKGSNLVNFVHSLEFACFFQKHPIYLLNIEHDKNTNIHLTHNTRSMNETINQYCPLSLLAYSFNESKTHFKWTNMRIRNLMPVTA